MSYYQRNGATHVDGTPIFRNADDEQNENSVAALLAQAFGCEIHSFGKLCPVDYYATRHGRLVGILELKSRTHDSTRHDTVFLNVRKWLALTLGSIGLGVPALFVVRFTDKTMWVPITEIDANARMGGCVSIVKSASDVEPVIDVPVHRMRPLVST